MAKTERLVHYTATEIDAMLARGETLYPTPARRAE